MSEQQEATKQEEVAKKLCVFKTIKPLSTKDEQGNWHPVLDDNGKQAFDNIAFMFKAKESDTLYGTVKTSDGQSHNVLGFIKERNEDGKPNFISLCIKDENDKLKSVGNINAINSRKDDKPVYFDEAIITINNEVINTKVGKKVDDDLHKKLGFTSPRLERPKFDPNAPKASSPASEAEGIKKIKEANAEVEKSIKALKDEADKKKDRKRPKAK